MTEAAKLARKKYNKEYYERNKERIRQFYKTQRRENPERFKNYQEKFWENQAAKLKADD